MKRKKKKQSKGKGLMIVLPQPTWEDYVRQIDQEPDFIASRFMGIRWMSEQELLIAALHCPDCRKEWGDLTRRHHKDGSIVCDVCGLSIHVDHIEVTDENGQVLTLGVLLRSSFSERADFARYQYYLARIENGGRPLT